LIKPADRTESGYRLYDKDSERRIHFIKQAQHCGFTLTDIRDLLGLRNRDAACCGDVRNRAIEKKLQLEHKIKAMKSMSKALDHLIADCGNEARPVGECTILAALEQVAVARH
jgi:MerR family Zn(II)-responsive transcriptional regulator of zntA